jgi:hypothetical protein
MRAVVAGLIALVTAVDCAEAASLPETFRPVVSCIYDALKANPLVMDVRVYVQNRGRGPVVAYAYRDRVGNVLHVEFELSGPSETGRFGYVGDIMYSGNPLLEMLQDLKTRCKADGAYSDQVVIIQNPPPEPHRELVDMAGQ